MDDNVQINKSVARHFVIGLQRKEPNLSAREQLEAIIDFQARVASSASEEAKDYLARQIDALKEFIGDKTQSI